MREAAAGATGGPLLVLKKAETSTVPKTFHT